MNTKLLQIFLFFITSLMFVGTAQAHSPTPQAKVFFIGLKDGATLKNPIKLKFGIKAYGISPAGTKGKIRHTTGHHHLLLDAKKRPDMDEALPRNKTILHFDKGETEVVLKLKPGKHTLQLILGDESHEPLGDSLVSEKITIKVLK